MSASTRLGRGLILASTIVWLGAAVAGLQVLWAYDNEAGVAATALDVWPAASGLTRDTTRATLVLLAHPHCTCTRASLGELAEILARTRMQPKTYVVFLKPRGFASGWEQTDLWRTASALPGVTVITDHEGTIAERFGAATSGQTFLYDARGVLIFSGGITGARAHAGDNAGRAGVLSLLAGQERADSLWTRVFGCSLFGPDNDRSAAP